MGYSAAEIARALNGKNLKACPRCGNGNFSGVDGVIALSINPDTDQMQIGGPNIPAVAVACDKCGFISLHSAMVLGLT